MPSGLPDVVLPCLGGGREVRLAGLRGKPMMINVWAQWCGPCREEAPYLAEVARHEQVRSADHRESITMIPDRSWRSSSRSCPPGDTRSSPIQMSCSASALQISGPPQTFFVRPDGTIAYRHAGPFHSAAEIRDLARKHLGVTP